MSSNPGTDCSDHMEITSRPALRHGAAVTISAPGLDAEITAEVTGHLVDSANRDVEQNANTVPGVRRHEVGLELYRGGFAVLIQQTSPAGVAADVRLELFEAPEESGSAQWEPVGIVSDITPTLKPGTP